MEAIVGKITTMLKSKLHGLKGKAMDQGKRKVMKYKDKLPTEDQITEKLKKSGCSEADKKRLESKYNKIKNALNKIKGMTVEDMPEEEMMEEETDEEPMGLMARRA